MHLSRTAMDQATLLSVQGVTLEFGGIRALNSVSFDVRRAGIYGVIGPNGAGKTSLFNCLSRLYQPSVGRIEFDGHDLLRVPVHDIARLGLGRTFQNLAVFPSLSVEDNVMVGAHTLSPTSILAGGLRLRSERQGDRQARTTARELLELVDLAEVAEEPVAALPFGLQKRMEIARALASNPQLLLLDEPAAGLNHEEIQALATLIRRLRDTRAITVLLVEHHMGLVMSLCDQLVVLNFGSMIAQGPPNAVRNDPEVIRAYLGGP